MIIVDQNDDDDDLLVLKEKNIIKLINYICSVCVCVWFSNDRRNGDDNDANVKALKIDVFIFISEFYFYYLIEIIIRVDIVYKFICLLFAALFCFVLSLCIFFIILESSSSSSSLN